MLEVHFDNNMLRAQAHFCLQQLLLSSGHLLKKQILKESIIHTVSSSYHLCYFFYRTCITPYWEFALQYVQNRQQKSLCGTSGIVARKFTKYLHFG